MSIRNLVLPLLLTLAACTACSAKPVPGASPDSVVPVDPGSLQGYHWKLQSAIDAHGKRIAALFVRTDRPVQLDFSQNHLTIGQLCNARGANYRIEQGQLVLGPMLSTQMACLQAGLGGLDQAVVQRLKSRPSISIDREGAMPQLQLATADGDVLQFTGQPTAERRYGGPGQVEFLEVAAQDVPCGTGASGGTRCLSVRDRHYDVHGLKSGEPGPWHDLASGIEGYTHEPGTRNVLRVKRFDTSEGPVYVLDMVVESEKVAMP